MKAIHEGLPDVLSRLLQRTDPEVRAAAVSGMGAMILSKQSNAEATGSDEWRINERAIASRLLLVNTRWAFFNLCSAWLSFGTV